MIWYLMSILSLPITYGSTREGNVFTLVSDSVHGGEGGVLSGGGGSRVHTIWVLSWEGGYPNQVTPLPPQLGLVWA